MLHYLVTLHVLEEGSDGAHVFLIQCYTTCCLVTLHLVGEGSDSMQMFLTSKLRLYLSVNYYECYVLSLHPVVGREG